MPINFPSSPTLNERYTYNMRTWQWNGNAWIRVQSGVARVVGEVPGGAINGTNVNFTTASAFVTGSLCVYLNGQRLTEGGDYTEGAAGFVMAFAPESTDVLTVDYDINLAEIVVGATTIVTNEVPSGAVNGSNKVFTFARGFVPGSLQLFRDGQLLRAGGHDYTETDPAAGSITMVSAPVAGTVMLGTYQSAVSATGNADTLDGYHALSFALNTTVSALGVISWQNVSSFSNGWANYGGAEPVAAYGLDGLGRLWFKGTIKNGTPYTAAFTLPVGYRPSVKKTILALSSAGSTYFDVTPDGDVKPYGTTSPTWFVLMGETPLT